MDLADRKSGHFCDLRRGRHRSKRLQHSYNKHGEAAFVFEVLQYVPDRTQLIRFEQDAIDLHRSWHEDCGYNINPTAGSNLGKKFSDESRQRMSESGRLRAPISEETRRKLSIAGKGRKQTPEAIAKYLSSRVYSPWTPEQRAAASAARKGRPQDPQIAAKRAAALRAWHATPEGKAAMKARGIARRGYVPSAETRAKIGAAHRGKKHDAARIEKNRLGHLGLRRRQIGGA